MVRGPTAPASAASQWTPSVHENIPHLVPFRPEIKDVFAADDTMRTQTMRFGGALQAGFSPHRARVRAGRGPMFGFDAAALDADFFPDSRWKLILVVNIGHPGPDPWLGRLPGLDHADVITWA